MALKKDLHSIAANLLSNVPVADLKELIDVLKFFNENFNEKDRATAFKNGFQGETPKQQEARSILEKSASQDFYLQSKNPVCRCCGR
jgi:hypothetical protein